MAEISPECPHKLILDGRKKLTVTGVTEVESFDDSAACLRTAQGLLYLRGRQLHLQMLSPDGGQVCVDGLVEAMEYEEDARHTGGFLARLFR